MLLLRGVLGGLFQVASIGAPLLIIAAILREGDWYWERALILLAVWAVMVQFFIFALAIFRPASLAVRLQGIVAEEEKKQPFSDIVVTTLLVSAVVALVGFIPLDVFWLLILPAPPEWLGRAGLLIFVYGYLIAAMAIFQNQFAAPTVQDQRDDAQRIVETGLYGIVRHPFYHGFLVLFVGMALWLGSVAGAVLVVGLLLILMMRIAIEEAALKRDFPGYAAYADRVRWRVFPFVY